MSSYASMQLVKHFSNWFILVLSLVQEFFLLLHRRKVTFNFSSSPLSFLIKRGWTVIVMRLWCQMYNSSVYTILYLWYTGSSFLEDIIEFKLPQIQSNSPFLISTLICLLFIVIISRLGFSSRWLLSIQKINSEQILSF